MARTNISTLPAAGMRGVDDAVAFNPLDHPVSLIKPRFLTGHSAWEAHVPFALFAIDAVRPDIFVELGTHAGDSYCAFCQAVVERELPTRCYAVDTWAGDVHSGSYGPELLAALRAHHDPQYNSFSTLMQMTFDEAKKHFADRSVDLLHIDGYHTYEAVRDDFNSWLPKMSPRGVILFHDTNVRKDDFGVWRFWDEVSKRYPHFEFTHGHGLGVLAVGNEVPAPLKVFFEASEQHQLRLRSFFSALGERVSNTRCATDFATVNKNLLAAHNEVVRLRTQVATLQADNDVHRAARAELLARAERAETELATFKSGMGVRMLTGFWKMKDAVLKPGSTGRAVYDSAVGALKRR